jgi:SAM-dependent methyltransferase
MGYFPDAYGPAVYDIYFDSARGCAEGLVEACSGFFTPGARILDVGAGTGNVSCEAARRFGDSSIVGVDIDEGGLELARHKAAQYSLGNVEFESGNALHLPYADNAFDAVLASQVVGGRAEQRKMLSEMLRVVRPGGGVGVARSNPDLNEVMQWIADVALEMSSRRGIDPPPIERNPWMNTLPVSSMLEQAGVREIKRERLISAQTDFSTFLINLMTQGRNLLELVDYVTQGDSGDSAAQTRGCWEFLQIGRELLDRKYGGKLEVSCEVVSGTKVQRLVPVGTANRRV